MIRAGLVALVLLVALPGNGWGIFYSGNELLDRCNSAPDVCIGFVMAISDAMGGQLLEGTGTTLFGRRACIPVEAKGGQVKDVVVKYLTDHPEYRHFAAVSLVVEALSLAFPCPP